MWVLSHFEVKFFIYIHYTLCPNFLWSGVAITNSNGSRRDTVGSANVHIPENKIFMHSDSSMIVKISVLIIYYKLSIEVEQIKMGLEWFLFGRCWSNTGFGYQSRCRKNNGSDIDFKYPILNLHLFWLNHFHLEFSRSYNYNSLFAW